MLNPIAMLLTQMGHAFIHPSAAPCPRPVLVQAAPAFTAAGGVADPAIHRARSHRRAIRARLVVLHPRGAAGGREPSGSHSMLRVSAAGAGRDAVHSDGEMDGALTRQSTEHAASSSPKGMIESDTLQMAPRSERDSQGSTITAALLAICALAAALRFATRRCRDPFVLHQQRGSGSAPRVCVRGQTRCAHVHADLLQLPGSPTDRSDLAARPRPRSRRERPSLAQALATTGGPRTCARPCTSQLRLTSQVACSHPSFRS